MVKWTKDGGNIDTKDGHFTITQASNMYNLIIKDVKPEDAGCYQAEFTNRAGEKKVTAELIVHCKLLTWILNNFKRISREISSQFIKILY